MSANNQNQDRRQNSLYIIEVERAHDRQPIFKGKVNFEGKELDIALWEKEPKDGKRFFTGSLSDPAEYKNRQQKGASGEVAAPRQTQPQRQAPPKQGEGQAFDDIFGSEGDQW